MRTGPVYRLAATTSAGISFGVLATASLSLNASAFFISSASSCFFRHLLRSGSFSSDSAGHALGPGCVGPASCLMPSSGRCHVGGNRPALGVAPSSRGYSRPRSHGGASRPGPRHSGAAEQQSHTRLHTLSCPRGLLVHHKAPLQSGRGFHAVVAELQSKHSHAPRA